MAQVHRFHSTVAISLGTGKTAYLMPDDAKAIAEAILEGVEDIEMYPKFSQGQFRTFEKPLDYDATDCHHQFKE